MSKTASALIYKFILTFLIATVAFVLIDRNALIWAFVVGLVGTVLNYLLGDLIILPKFGNIVASVGDGVLAALTALLVGILTPAFQTTTTSLLIFAVLIAVGEYFFHQYLLRSEEVEP